MKPYLAVVTWEDAWRRTGDLPEGGYAPYLVESVGWITQLDEKVCMLACWRTTEQNAWAEKFNDFQAIPRGMVRKIQKLHV